MAFAKKCDICGKLYEEYNTKENKNKTNGLTFLNIDYKGNYFAHKAIDCCPGCMKTIKHYIESIRNGGCSNTKVEE